MSDLRKWYRQGLTARIDALDAAQALLDGKRELAYESIRRIAHSLRGPGMSSEFPEIAASAGSVEEAPDDVILDRIEALLISLRDEVASRGDSRVKLLVIEEDAPTAQLLRATLATQNRDVMMVDTATDAEAVLTEEEISLIILDLVLPDTDGRNLLLKLRQRPRTAATPIFVLSGLPGSQPTTECFALGADEYLPKPVNPEALSAAVSSKLQRAAEVDRNARHDALTGLKNRAAFTDAFEHELSVSRRNKTPLSVAIFDLDRFKRINDLYGSTLGDEVLRKVADWVGETLRGSDVVARWGGDEFAVLMPNTELEGAVNALHKVQTVLREQPVIVEGVIKVKVTCSAGVTAVEGGISLVEAMTAADRHLYLAKLGGRNRIVVSDDEVMPDTKTILLAEDDAVTARLIEHRMRREGFDVVHFTNGSDAAVGAAEIEASLVILDGMMPGMDGFELLRELRRTPAYTDTPILMLTSTGRERDIVRAFDLGASDYVTKPFSAAELVARVHRLLREHEVAPRR